MKFYTIKLSFEDKVECAQYENSLIANLYITPNLLRSLENAKNAFGQVDIKKAAKRLRKSVKLSLATRFCPKLINAKSYQQLTSNKSHLRLIAKVKVVVMRILDKIG